MSVRWSFNISEWNPTTADLSKISEIIQEEEKERISRFHFIADAKASLIGRLLIRKIVGMRTGVGNHLIKLGRDKSNKPVLIYPDVSSLDGNGNNSLNFNVSHQGSFVVLASDPYSTLVGIDVMNIQKPGRISDTVDSYFKLMNRQFTENEWRQIKGLHLSDEDKIKNFTRFWCLKEAYVKGIGVGIVMDLKTVDFYTKTDLDFNSGKILATDTTVRVNGCLEGGWTFEERFLDKDHIVTVGKNDKKKGEEEPQEFEEKPLEFLTKDMTPLQEEDGEWVNKFLNKKKHNEPN